MATVVHALCIFTEEVCSCECVCVCVCVCEKEREREESIRFRLCVSTPRHCGAVVSNKPRLGLS